MRDGVLYGGMNGWDLFVCELFNHPVTLILLLNHLLHSGIVTVKSRVRSSKVTCD